MANIKSQIKRNKQNNKSRLRNRVYRGSARIAVKDARTAIDAGVPESKAALINAISALDKAAEKDVIHKKNAARRKSRLMKAFAKMEPAKVEPQTDKVVSEPAAVEPEVKKAAPRKRAAKPESEAAAEPKAKAEKAPAASSPKKKASATPKKTPAKKTA